MVTSSLIRHEEKHLQKPMASISTDCTTVIGCPDLFLLARF
jgi:hypothetical protein